MAKLILSMDGLVLKEIPLTKERMTIGRKPHNDIQIDNLAISGEHAALVTILNDSFLEDLNSTNGTLVNGQPIKKHFLQNGDVVELGKYKLKFISDLPAAREGETDFEKTMVLRPGSIQPQEAPAASAVGEATHANFGDVRIPSPPPAAPAAAAAPLLGVVQILNGANAGKELELVKTLTTLGKPGVQVASITKRPGGYVFAHVEGNARPTVNSMPVHAEPIHLKDGDVIELAGTQMQFVQP